MGAEVDTLRESYDVVIIGGAIMGSSIAWHLASDPDFDGTVLVIERDPSYEMCSTAHTNSCIRQQFSSPINIRISQFGVEVIRNFRSYLGGDEEVPEIPFLPFGYLYLAGSGDAAARLRANWAVQADLGVGTQLLRPDEIAARFPFYNVSDLALGSHNPVDEGYFDGFTMFTWWRRKARQLGVRFHHAEAVGLDLAADGASVAAVKLADGTRIGCGQVVNAAGPRAARVAAMAGLSLPVEPRRRFSFVFRAEDNLGGALPLTIDPSGVHVRSEGDLFLAGCPPEDDQAVAPDDFTADHAIWEDKVWPALAHRIPAFERIRLVNSWVGHYAYNTLDQNAVLGPHTRLRNFLFANGFSGHGLQQSPAVGRGIAELVVHGRYRSLDLTPFGFDRIEAGRPFLETAVI